MLNRPPVGHTRDFEGCPAESVDDGYERRTLRGRGFRAWFARTLLRIGGWKIGGPPLALDKYVIVAAPHTAWWDGVWMLAIAWSWGVDLAWMGKASLTKGPLGWIPRRFGVIPVERSTPQGLVTQVVEQFATRDSMLLAIPPEGTRSKRDYWKSGFYQIARMAELPICMSYLDYSKHEAGFGPCFEVSDDIVADMDRIRAFYKVEWGKYPKLFTPPRLREETMSPVVELPRFEHFESDDAASMEPIREVAQG
jgi:1-acyl-sn-glycerol-3-phosphate acyltransferase